MPYARKYKSRGKSAATNRKIVSRKPTASNQKYQILSLNKKVNKLSRRISDNTYKVMNKASLSESNFASNAYIYNLTNIPSWTSVFGETDNTEEGGKYKSSKMTIDFAITTATETESVVWTLFICTPKTQKVAEESASSSGTLSVLSDGKDYTMVEGKALMNLKRWNVHYCSRGATTPVVTEAQSNVPTVMTNFVNEVRPARRFINIRKPNIHVINRDGLWNAVSPDKMNHNQRYTAMLFNNNASTLEGSPRFSMTVLHTGVVSQ